MVGTGINIGRLVRYLLFARYRFFPLEHELQYQMSVFNGVDLIKKGSLAKDGRYSQVQGARVREKCISENMISGDTSHGHQLSPHRMPKMS